MLSYFKLLSFNARIVAICGLGLLLILIIVGAKACYTNSQIEKTDKDLQKYEANTANSQVDLWAANQDAKDRERDAQKAQDRQQSASQTFHNSKQSDSNKFQNGNAGVRFCQKFPSDSTCVQK